MSYRGRSFSRGRGFAARGNSGERPNSFFRGRGRRNFFDDEVANQEQRKVDEKKEQIENKKAEQPPKVDEEKKADLVNKGKQWFNKFFGGIKKKERANIKVEFNRDLDVELYAAYEPKLTSLASSSYYYNSKSIQDAPKFLRPYINILLGIKLLAASTIDDKGLMKGYLPLINMEIEVPKNLGVLIDCIGKTDAINDNVVRIIGQNSVIKERFLKACIDAAMLGQRNYFDNMSWADNITFTDIENLRRNHILKKSTLKLYSADRNGISIINDYGKDGIEYLNKHDFEITVNNRDYPLRLPYLDPKHAKDIDKIMEWEKKVSGFFSAIKFDPDKYSKTMGLALLSWLPLRFIQNRSKSFQELDKRFRNTVFGNLKPLEILVQDNWYCIDDWCSDNQLYDNVVYLVQMYKTKFKKIYEEAFHMVKFQPSEFGNSAQLVMGHKSEGIYLDNQEYTDKVEIIKNDRCTSSFIKMNDEESILGSVFKFNNNVKYKSGYEIHVIGSSKEIRNSFIFHDYK